MTRLFALLGAGEFEEWHGDLDRWLLERAAGDGRVLILPTASAKEGDDVFDGWASKGVAHYERSGIPVEVVPLKAREDAERDDLVARLEDASMVFFSGGNPWYLAEVLRDTAFCRTMFDGMERGLAYAGCSAGVACLTEMTFDSETQDMERVFKPGLGYVRDLVFGPHWDMIDTWVPGATTFIVGSVKDGQAFVGIDENTAMVGDGDDWSVMGVGGVHLLRGGDWEHLRAPATFGLSFGDRGERPSR
jgi:cyanophycinase